MILYHGTGTPLELNPNTPIYATPDIKCAREYAAGLNDLGHANSGAFVYTIEFEGEITEVEDFDEFDNLAYANYDAIPEVAHNPESGWYCIKHPKSATLVEHNRAQ